MQRRTDRGCQARAGQLPNAVGGTAKRASDTRHHCDGGPTQDPAPGRPSRGCKLDVRFRALSRVKEV